jgi:hypothetical protein
VVRNNPDNPTQGEERIGGHLARRYSYSPFHLPSKRRAKLAKKPAAAMDEWRSLAFKKIFKPVAASLDQLG